jgi:hypothetical protein
MSHLFLATLGQRPEAITVAFDHLNERYSFEGVVLLTTDPDVSDIDKAYDDLIQVFKQDYPGLRVHSKVIRRPNGDALIDIVDSTSAEDYLHGMLDILHGYKREGYNLHLLIAGGRKAMSIYGMVAASLVFNPGVDKVWTVISPKEILKPGQFHAPPAFREQIQAVELLLVTARVPQGADPYEVLLRRRSTRADFIARLTSEEQRLCNLLIDQPYASNQELGGMLNKSERTVENQLRSVYAKLTGFLDLGERVTNKRQALLDMLRGE